MRNRLWTVCLIGALFFSGCTVQSPAALFASPTPSPIPATPVPPTPVVTMPADVEQVDWQRCDDIPDNLSELRCAVVTVPLDYTKPTGETIGIHVIRRPAYGTDSGVILVNPGGPGESGVKWMVDSDGGKSLSGLKNLEDFDLISFDPRGTGASGGLFCQTDAEIDRYRYPDTTPDSPEETAFYTEATHAFPTACRSKYGDTIRLYSTVNAARDMEMIRRALRVDQINYIGFSYGTYLGGVYAHLFPAQVRAMILDGAFQPEGDTIEQQYTTQTGGFGKAMENWIVWCQDPVHACAFAAKDVGARWDALWAQYDANPVTAADGRVANQATVRDATKNALYAESMWPELGKLLAEAEAGKTDRMWKIVDWFDDRDENGHYTASESAFPLIMCASGIVWDTPTDPAALLQTLRSLSPHFTKDYTAEHIAEPDDCLSLVHDAQISPISNRANAPILVIGGENDPATPMRWAEKMVTDLGPQARLIRFSGEGHTVLGDAVCVDTIANTLLTKRELPPKTVTCAPDPDVVAPSWWARLPQPPAGTTALSPAAIAAFTHVERREGYGTGYLYSGDTASGEAAVTAALRAAGFTAPLEFHPFYNGRLAWYDDGDIVFAVFVAGNDRHAETDKLDLASIVPNGQGLIHFLYMP